MKFLTKVFSPLGNNAALRGLVHKGQGRGVSPKFHARRAEFFRHQGQKGRGCILVYKQAFQGVTYAWPLHLAVKNNIQRALKVGVRLDIGVAHALEVLEHGHGGGFGNRAYKPFAAAGDDHVNILVKLAQGVHSLMPRDRHKLRRRSGQPGLDHGFLQGLGQGCVGVYGLAAATQNNGITRLDAQDGRINGYIGASLVNHGDHAERYAHLAYQQAVGPLPLAFGSADRVWQVGHMGAGGAHFFHNGRSQRKAVQPCRILPGGPGSFNIAGVGGQNFRFALMQQLRQAQQGLVLGFGRGPGHGPRRILCLRAKTRHFFSRRHASSLWQRP